MVYYLVKKTENELVLQLLSNVKVSTKKRKNVKICNMIYKACNKTFQYDNFVQFKRFCQKNFRLSVLEWQPCHFPVMVICFVEVNIPKVLLIFFNKVFICSMPYFNYHLFSIEDSLDLALNSSGLFTYLHDKHIHF